MEAAVSERTIVIFGAGGRLGREILHEFSDKDYVIAAPDRGLDVTNVDQVKLCIENFSPSLIINCTAMNGLEACQENPARAYLTNLVAPVAMAEEARKRGAFFLHFSTDYAAVPCGNGDTATWLTYGRSKLLGEEAVAEIGGYYMILRLSSIYSIDTLEGSLDPVRQFIKGFGTQDKPIKVLPQFTTPTSTRLVAKVVKKMFKLIDTNPRRYQGVYDLAARGPVWKSDFARWAIEAFCGKQNSPVTIIEGQPQLSRPVYSVLDPSPLLDLMTGVIYIPEVIEDLLENAKVWHSRQHDPAHNPRSNHGH